MTYRCPIDGRELADGKPCPEHGLAYSSTGLESENARVVARATPLVDKQAPRKRAAKK